MRRSRFAGFLCESFDYLKRVNPKRTTARTSSSGKHVLWQGEEVAGYVIAIMNMTCTASRHRISCNQHTFPKPCGRSGEGRYDVILPIRFRWQGAQELQQNFPIRTGETAFLFPTLHQDAEGRPDGGCGYQEYFPLQYRYASVGSGRCCWKSCNFNSARLPRGTFQGAGVRPWVLL